MNKKKNNCEQDFCPIQRQMRSKGLRCAWSDDCKRHDAGNYPECR